MFKKLLQINQRPQPFEFYTAAELWTNEHTSKKMLEYHLNEKIDVSSRNIDFIYKSVNWITNNFKLKTNSTLIDFGCGPGLYTTRFAEKGIKVTGIDFSRRSIDYARETALGKSLEINYVNKNYLEFETAEKYDLITMIMCDFCALSPVQRKTLLTKFKTMLKPGGSILLDVYTLNAFAQKQEQAFYEFNHLNHFWSAEDYYCFVNIFKYDTEKIILDKYTIIEENRTRIVYNWLQYFSEESLTKEFAENGLQVKEIFTDVAGRKYNIDSQEMAIIAILK